jgi:hypothetical protein
MRTDDAATPADPETTNPIPTMPAINDRHRDPTLRDRTWQPDRAAGRPAPRVSLTGTLLLAVLAAGCGGSLTAGGFAEIELVVSGDAPGASPSIRGPAVTAAALRQGITPLTAHDDVDDDLEGEIELEFLLYLVRPDGSEERLSEDGVTVEVDLAGELEVDAFRTRVPAETYTALRIVFTEIEVEIDKGVVIDGIPVTGPIDIELDDDELVEVIRPLQLSPQDGDRVELLLDINSRIWLQAIDPNLRTVAESVFAEAITVVAR